MRLRELKSGKRNIFSPPPSILTVGKSIKEIRTCQSGKM